MQHVLFRADASVSMGSGHVMRCLTLANRIRARGGRALFVCVSHPGHMASAIEQQGHKVVLLSSQAGFTADAALAPWESALQQADAQATMVAAAEQRFDWLVTDHYGLDATWERISTRVASRLLSIDDLANRPHHGNLLLDQNLGRHPSDYAALLPAGCPALTGPRYALLRDDFAIHRASSLARRRAARALRHILVSMGGTDSVGATGRVLTTLRHCVLPLDARITVVMGATAPTLDAIKTSACGMPWPTQVVVNVSNMAQLLSEADLAIGASGGSAWERCCLGVPSLVVVLADNQRSGAQALAHAGAALLIGDASDIEAQMPSAIDALRDGTALVDMAALASTVTDGQGVERVVTAMETCHA